MPSAKIHSLPRRKTGCPICGKPPAPDLAPFCSTRCRDVDLARWFGETYAIPAVEADDDERGQPEPDGAAD
ncbi:MAG: DNA gyrase inhibitor YacG [Alphaproteobacteria bacterium]